MSSCAGCGIPDAPWLIAVQLLDGVGTGVFGAVTPLVIADLMRETGSYNLARAGATVPGRGASLSGPVAGIIVDHFRYSAAFLTSGVAACGALAALFLAMSETARDVGVSPRSFNGPRKNRRDVRGGSHISRGFCRQCVGQFALKIGNSERLGQEPHPRVKGAVVNDGVARVASHVNDLKIGSESIGRLCQLASGAARHDDIRDRRSDLFRRLSGTRAKYPLFVYFFASLFNGGGSIHHTCPIRKALWRKSTGSAAAGTS
jgi:hypothetical protein